MQREEKYPKLAAEKNLKIAKEAGIYANRISHKSTSRDQLNFTERELFYNEEFKKLNAQFQQLRDLHRIRVEDKLSTNTGETYNHSPQQYNSDEYRHWAKIWYEAGIDASKKMGLGNCQEYALLAMEFCLNFSNLSVEMFAFSKNFNGEMKDHAFLVIGRDKSKNPLNIDEWGPDAVICDPWARKYYKASLENVKTNLKYITENYNSSTGETSRVLRAFNPECDRLRLCMSIDMVKDVKDEKKTQKKSRI